MDYASVKWFDTIKKGDTIAIYHDATVGRNGYTVLGTLLYGKKGKDLPVLTGKGFIVDKNKHNYVSIMDGKIEIINGKVIITPMLIVENVSVNSGKIEFDGTIHVLGDILAGSEMTATKDIIVDGGVEGCHLQAGENIILKNGCNANGNGEIVANGDVHAKFFERVTVKAGKSIHTNTSLSSDLSAEENILLSGSMSTLSGGKAVAGITIITGELGNSGGLLTKVALNGQKKWQQELQEKRKQMDAMRAELQLLVAAKNQLQKKMTLVQRNTHPLYQKVEKSIYEKRQQISKAEQEFKQFEKENRKYLNTRIEVLKELFTGVEVTIGNCKWTARNARNVMLQERGDHISILPRR